MRVKKFKVKSDLEKLNADNNPKIIAEQYLMFDKNLIN